LRAHETVPRFTGPQFVPGAQQRLEVVLFGGDVVHRDHDVDYRFCCQPGDGGGTDVLDAHVRCESGQDLAPVLQVAADPPLVMAVELEREWFGATDQLYRRDVRPPRTVASLHQNMLASANTGRRPRR
jgi:hypothetical protein